ncbi:hypothetical protein MAHJHV35_47810 [Mycobacterium avium subsp. hominissuis]
MSDDKMLARIAALLRQAEGTDNSHEADMNASASWLLSVPSACRSSAAMRASLLSSLTAPLLLIAALCIVAGDDAERSDEEERRG